MAPIVLNGRPTGDGSDVIAGIFFAAGDVPDRPLHMRINRLNILADRRLWTPTIASLNRAGVRFGLGGIACMVGFVVSLSF